MKKIIYLVLAVLMTCALMACNSAKTSDIDDLQQKITELQEQLDSQSNKNKELQEQLDRQSSKSSRLENDLFLQQFEFEERFKQQKKEFEEELKQRDKKLKELEDDIDYLERRANGIVATSYPLYVAYDNGWLTRDDLMHILYFRNGYVIGYDEDNRSKYEIDFKPTMETPIMTERLEMEFKEAYYKANQDKLGGYEKSEALQMFGVKYLGQYNDVYVVETISYALLPGLSGSYVVAGIVFGYSISNHIQVLRFE